MFPSIQELRSLEQETLQVISSIGEFNRFGNLYTLAQNYRTLVPQRGPVNIEVGLQMDIRLRGDVGKTLAMRNVYLGVLVVPAKNDKSIARASYSLTICKDHKPTSRIIRKLHIDFEPAIHRQSSEIKPSVHLQVCGELSGHLRSIGYRDEHLNSLIPSFEKPRVPIMPTSLALLINWVLLEFQTDRTADSVTRNPQWRNLVRQAERVVLKPYFDSCAQFLGAASKNERSFIEENLYEVQR